MDGLCHRFSVSHLIIGITGNKYAIQVTGRQVSGLEVTFIMQVFSQYVWRQIDSRPLIASKTHDDTKQLADSII